MYVCKVSVIIATYNTADYLEECLDSIFNQTLREIEVVLIDDGSTDDTETIIKKCREKHDNLVARYQENQGAGMARNYGIALASGEYMIFMDPDDKYPCDDCLEKLYLTAKEQNVLICGGNILINDNGVVKSGYRAGEGDIHCSRNQVIDVKDYFYMVGHTRYLFETELIKKNDIWFANYKRYEDQMFTVKVLGLAGRFYELDYSVYEYRINYKKLKINIGICLDILRGFRDTLELVCRYGLRWMFEKNYDSFIHQYMPQIAEYAFCENQEFDQVIYDINEIVEKSDWHDEKYLITHQKVFEYKDEVREAKKKLGKLFESEKPIIIYGAGENTKKLILNYRQRMKNVVGVAVSEVRGNDLEIEGFKVRNIKRYNAYRTSAVVLITPNVKVKGEIIEKLKELSFEHFEWIDMRLI